MPSSLFKRLTLPRFLPLALGSLLLLLLAPARSATAQETCWRVYEQIIDKAHSRANWMTVATFPPRGYRDVGVNAPCMSFQTATALMDRLRAGTGFFDECHPYNLWESRIGNQVQRTAAPFEVTVGGNFIFRGRCGCCEMCMWQADPTGTMAGEDCRAFALTSVAGLVVVNNRGQAGALNGPISVPAPGGPFVIPAFAGRLQVRQHGVAGVWMHQNGIIHATEAGDIVAMTAWFNNGGKMVIRGRRSGNTITYNWGYEGQGQQGTGVFQMMPDGLSMQGSWQASGGQSDQWTITRFAPAYVGRSQLATYTKQYLSYLRGAFGGNTETPPPDPPPGPETGSSCDKECAQLCRADGKRGGRFTGGICLLGVESLGQCECN